MSQINEQTTDYQLADLSPVLKAANSGNTLLENLPVWLSAQTRKSAGRGRSASNTLQYGVQKLRELILELAVRGKLVPKDSNDEPARILLEKIAEEKAQLVKEGIIKKQKTLSEIKADEFISHLPKGWALARLGQLFHIVYGKGLSSKELENEGYDVFGANGIIGKYNRFNYQDKQLLVSCRGAYSGKPNISPPNCFVTSNSLVLENKWNYLCLEYFYYSLTIADKSKIVTGSAQPQVTTTNLEPFIVGIPPLAEQHRIVKKVDELMALCDQLELQQADAVQAHDTLVKVLLDTLTQSENAEDFKQNWRRIAEHFDTLFTTESSIDQLKQSLLQLAVMGKLVSQDPNDEPASVLLEKVSEEKARLVKEGKIKKQNDLPEISVSDMPFIHPYGWIFSRTQSLCLKITDGEHATPRRAESGQYLLSARNITNEGISLSDVDFVPDEEFERIRKRCDPNIGDILISCSGSVGRVALVDKDDAYSMVRSAAMIRPTPSYLSKEYLCIMYKSPFLQEQMQKGSKKSAQANLFLGAISNLIAIIPPLAEQQRIVKKVDELMALCDQLKDRLNQAQALQQQLADTVVSKSVYDDCH